MLGADLTAAICGRPRGRADPVGRLRPRTSPVSPIGTWGCPSRSVPTARPSSAKGQWKTGDAPLPSLVSSSERLARSTRSGRFDTVRCMPELPLDQILDQVRAALHGKRAPLLERVQRIERALAEYGAALEEKIARTSLASMRSRSRRAVATSFEPRRSCATPCSRCRSSRSNRPTRHSEQADADPVFEPEPASVAPATHAPPLVVVGGVPRPERARALPKSVADRIEWIDTTRQGTVAIGNLTQRLAHGAWQGWCSSKESSGIATATLGFRCAGRRQCPSPMPARAARARSSGRSPSC